MGVSMHTALDHVHVLVSDDGSILQVYNGGHLTVALLSGNHQEEIPPGSILRFYGTRPSLDGATFKELTPVQRGQSYAEWMEELKREAAEAERATIYMGRW